MPDNMVVTLAVILVVQGEEVFGSLEPCYDLKEEHYQSSAIDEHPDVRYPLTFSLILGPSRSSVTPSVQGVGDREVMNEMQPFIELVCCLSDTQCSDRLVLCLVD